MEKVKNKALRIDYRKTLIRRSCHCSNNHSTKSVKNFNIKYTCVPLKWGPWINSEKLTVSVSSPLSDFENSAIADFPCIPPKSLSNWDSASVILPCYNHIRY